ncbi:Cyn operon transcriptional activator [Shimia thalassica]|uniref:Cyn operon transcriptional activator n=1 Tax=Shimia thalassica TaxID=1715693 RepID=A0A0P1I8M1_9RHOB|nr:LysR family transcriptional regulator [Shimia thalassica]CUJ97820.1 Cyn operon transcriptional activator [Shimia thalassica]
MLNENALNAFLALAKTGSFQDAARLIGVSNASLSRYIVQVETETGLTLFNRSRNNSKLTREGQEYLSVAQDLKSDLERYQRRVVDLGNTNGGMLRIGCGPLTTRTLILPVLRKVREEMPDLRFEVLVSAYARPLDLLQKDQFDIFVGDLTYTPEADDVEILVVEKQPVVFMAHPAHEIHERGPQSLGDVFEFPFASPHLHKHWKATLTKALGGDARAAQKVAALPQIESDDYAFLTSLLERPDIIVGGMRGAFTELLASGQVKEVDVIAPPFWNICASRKSNGDSAALNLFWSTLVELNTISQ